jgi:hypothetical protein
MASATCSHSTLQDRRASDDASNTARSRTARSILVICRSLTDTALPRRAHTASVLSPDAERGPPSSADRCAALFETVVAECGVSAHEDAVARSGRATASPDVSVPSVGHATVASISHDVMRDRALRGGRAARLRRRAVLLFGLFALEIAACVVSTPQAAAKGGGGGVWAAQCGSTTYQLTFRPKGQPDLRAGRYRYPANAAPYLVVYKGSGHPDPLTQFALFLDANGRESLASTCHPAVAPASTTPIAKRKTTHNAATLTCRFASEPVIRVTTLATDDRVRRLISIIDATGTATTVRFTSTAALDYTPTSCTTKAIP